MLVDSNDSIPAAAPRPGPRQARNPRKKHPQQGLRQPESTRLSSAAGPAMGKKDKAEKEKKKVEEDGDEEDGPVKQRLVSPIANPLASKKLTKKALKTIKKAAKAKMIRRGVKEVVKAIKKGEKGLVIIAGDISPIDVIAHVPILCEEKARASPRTRPLTRTRSALPSSCRPALGRPRPPPPPPPAPKRTPPWLRLLGRA